VYEHGAAHGCQPTKLMMQVSCAFAAWQPESAIMPVSVGLLAAVWPPFATDADKLPELFFVGSAQICHMAGP
jgi:hypothetical protein